MTCLRATKMDIKKIRKSWGISGREFAAIIGYQDCRTIRRIEAGGQELSGAGKKLIEIYLGNPYILARELNKIKSHN